MRSLSANPYRGEAMLEVAGEALLLRPTFSALIAAEGQLRLTQIVALFDHLSKGRPEAITRGRIGEAVIEKGLAKITPLLRTVLAQILQGR